ncbi:MAG: type II secretion system protein [Victivallales bacterium]
MKSRHLLSAVGRRSFTLLEVVVALAVLGLAIVSSMEMCSSAVARMEKAKARWRNQHMISQAAEFFLLAGPGAQLPHEIFPFSDARASCSVDNAQGLPADVDTVSGQWRLATYHVQLYDSSGKNISFLKIDKIIQVSDQ